MNQTAPHIEKIIWATATGSQEKEIINLPLEEKNGLSGALFARRKGMILGAGIPTKQSTQHFYSTTKATKKPLYDHDYPDDITPHIQNLVEELGGEDSVAYFQEQAIQHIFTAPRTAAAGESPVSQSKQERLRS
ncbi:hypothetical protein K3495_g7496 [Podosphaera aphanis]|nr:hypothetical protein K3495_g7496 [Podosphaera aphanis]